MGGRAVKAVDSKSTGCHPRVFESRPKRIFFVSGARRLRIRTQTGFVFVFVDFVLAHYVSSTYHPVPHDVEHFCEGKVSPTRTLVASAILVQ